MLVRIQRIGSGAAGDSFRIPLPNYTLVTDDVAGGNHVISVPDDDFPPGFIGNPGLAIAAVAAGNAIVGVPPGLLIQWRQHLENKYGRAPGTYNPNVR